MDKDYAEYLLNKTREDYNLIAEEFSMTRWDIWSEFNIFRGYIKDGDRVLDIGCGNGRLLKLLKDKNIDYIGVDNSEKLINLAKEKYPQNRFLVADSLNLPFPENYFDEVFLIAVLHNVPSKEFRLQILKEAKRVLKQDGILIIKNTEEPKGFNCKNGPVFSCHLRYDDLPQIISKLKKYKFTIAEIATDNIFSGELSGIIKAQK